MQVAEVVVRILKDEGIDVAFGIPGASINPALQVSARRGHHPLHRPP